MCLREHVLRADVGRRRLDEPGQLVARRDQIVAAAGLQQRRRAAAFEVGVVGRELEQAIVEARGLRPAVIALVEIGQRREQLRRRLVGDARFEPCDRVGAPARARVRFEQQRRTVLPTLLLLDEIGQQRDCLVELFHVNVQPRERRPQVRIGFAERPGDGELEMRDRECRVIGRRGRRLRAPAAGLVVAGVAFETARVDDAEDAVRFRVGRRNLQRALGHGRRVGNLVLAEIQRGELRRNVRRVGIRFHPARVRRDRARLVVDVVEMAAHQELRVRLGDVPILRRRARLREGRRSHTDREQTSDRRAPHIFELFHKPEGVSYSRSNGRRPRTARDSRLSQLQNPGDARQERRRAQVRDVQTCVSDQR